MRIYLDLCRLNRPFDDQGQDRVRLESDAVLAIQRRVQEGKDELVSSEVLEIESQANRDSERRRKVQEAIGQATLRVEIADALRDRANRLGALGFAGFDSLHIACAEAARADVLLTTDDRFLRLAARYAEKLAIRVVNPVEWSRHDEDRTSDRE